METVGTQPSPRSILPWPAFILSLLLTFILFTWWSFSRATSGGSPVTDPEYYSHGLKYNGTALEREAGEALGWKVSQQVSGRHLTIRIEDSHQDAVAGCQGKILFPAEIAGREAMPPLPVTEVGNGLYQAELPATLPNTLLASLTLTKGKASVQRRLLLAL